MDLGVWGSGFREVSGSGFGVGLGFTMNPTSVTGPNLYMPLTQVRIHLKFQEYYLAKKVRV